MDFGPGYRIYYIHLGTTMVILLCGGDKGTQAKDIKLAHKSRRSGDDMAKIEFSPYDSADYLTSIEEIAYYLEAVLEEAGDDPAFIAQALGTIARSRNMSELARKVGMSREGLYKALSAEGNPSFATIFKVTEALGLKLEFRLVA